MKLGAVTLKKTREISVALGSQSETFFFSPLGKVLDCPLIGGITILCSWFSVTGKSTFLIYNSVHDGYADWLTFIEIGFLYVSVYTYKYFLPYENCSS